MSARERARLRRIFDRRAPGFEAATALAERVESELDGRLEWLAFAPRRVLDLGARTGRLSARLRRRYRRAQLIAVDASAVMLRGVTGRSGFWRPLAAVCAEAEALPIASGRVDLVCSSLLLPWLTDLDAAFAEAHRVLLERGCFSFATVGPATLEELRRAWSGVDRYAHLATFPDLPELAGRLVAAGFADPVLDVDRHRLHAPNVRELLACLHGSGAGVPRPDRRRSLLSRPQFERLEAGYEACREPAGLPVTVEVVYAQAWRPGPRPAQRARRGETEIAIGTIGRRIDQFRR